MDYRKMMRGLLVVIALAALTGCGEVNLYSQLTELQANEIIALLLSARIDADKEFDDKKNWAVKIAKKDLPKAVEVLHAFGYPREQYQSFGEIFKKDSFVSSPVEERARFLYGLSQELSRTISAIDGVIVARVHIALPEKDMLSDKIRPSSAAVFIKHRTESKIDNHVAAIKALVVNSIEGLPYENVTVTLFPADPWPNNQNAVQTAGDSGMASQPWFYPTAYSIAGVLALGVGTLIWLLLTRLWRAWTGGARQAGAAVASAEKNAHAAP